MGKFQTGAGYALEELCRSFFFLLWKPTGLRNDDASSICPVMDVLTHARGPRDTQTIGESHRGLKYGGLTIKIFGIRF